MLIRVFGDTADGKDEDEDAGMAVVRDDGNRPRMEATGNMVLA